MIKLKQLRLGEYLAIGWILFVATIYTAFRQWKDSNIVDDRVWWTPFFFPFLLTFSRYLIPFILISVRKLSATFTVLFAGNREFAAQAPIDFESETRLFQSMAGFFRDCAPLYLFVLFYPSTDFLLNCLQGTATVDNLLIKLDLMIFRVHLSVWMERFISPGLTEVLSLCYSLHPILVTAVLLFIYLYCRRTLFLEAMQGFMLMSIIGFTLYILVPGVGPNYTLVYTRDLAGGMIGKMNQVLINNIRVARDVFPSLHVALSALMLVYAWRANKRFFFLILPFTIGNWISTIYLRYHYTIDLAAGFLLVPIVYYIVGFWMRKFPEPEGG